MSSNTDYPHPSSPAVTQVMKGNVAKNSRPEVLLRRLLREAGYSGYRLHWKVEGRPDIAYPGRKVAVFLHGCFWHRCPHCDLPMPKANTDYWTSKFARNQARDERNRRALEEQGWTVVTVWECQLKKDSQSVIAEVVSTLRQTARER